MKDSAYKRFKLEQIARSEVEDSILVFANEMVQLKDDKRINLFWDKEEEKLLRSYVAIAKQYSKN